MSTTEPSVRFRPMITTDLIRAHELSRALRWPHRLQDWQWMHQISQGVIAEDTAGLLGTALCFLQGDYASVGLVIIAVERQGQGLGRKLLDQTLVQVQARTPILVATPRGAPLYASQGFTTYEHILQHQAASAPSLPDYEPPTGHVLQAVNPQDFQQLLELGSAATGMDRTRVLSALLEISQSVMGMKRDQQWVGFALLRPFGHGLAIGPVVAESIEEAKAMIATLLSQAAGQFIRLDVTQRSGLGDWLSEIGIPQVDDVAQMAKGAPPSSCGNAVQMALANQALC